MPTHVKLEDKESGYSHTPTVPTYYDMILIRIKSKNLARSSVNKDQQTNVTKCEGLNYLHRLPPTSPDKELRCAELENFYQLLFFSILEIVGFG